MIVKLFCFTVYGRKCANRRGGKSRRESALWQASRQGGKAAEKALEKP